jgi:hypothetical protein
MKKNLWVIRYSKPIIIISILLLLGSIIPLTQISINSDLESYMPESMESKISNKLISKHFSNDEILMLVLECEDVLSEKTLQRIENISSTFEQSALLGRVYSLFQVKDIVSDDGMMLVNPLIENIPENEAEKALLRQRIIDNDLAYKLIVSEDFRFTLIILTREKGSDDETIIAFINETLEQFPGDEKIYLTGQPVLRAEANANISRDIIILLPAGLLLMLFMLWLSFRDIRLVLLPFSIVLISMVIAMALIPALGWELSLIGILIPIMMIAIANNYGIHFIAGYQEIHARYPQQSHPKVIQTLLNNLRKPVILCGLTTMVGVLGLLAHLFVPAKQMGVVSSIAIGFALVLSLTFLPAVMSLFPRLQHEKPEKAHKKGFFDLWLHFAGSITTHHPKWVIAGFVLFFVLIGSGILRMKIAPDSNKILPAKHPFNQAIAHVDRHFGGSKQISIMFDGEATNPQLLKQIDSVSNILKTHPLIGNTTSLATMIRKMSMALNDPDDPGYNQIPESSEAIAQYLELYAMSADISDFEQFLSFDYQHTLLSVQYHAGTLKESEEVLQFIRSNLESVEFPVTIGGMSLIDKEISESVRNGQLYSLLAALLAIFILLSLIFRHAGAGITGSIPLLFAVMCTFGFMGWAGIELNIVTALLSSISIGLGVDFSIHLFWRIRREMQHNEDTGSAIRRAIAGVGRGISVNALSVMLGFSVLFLSSFPFIRSFALLIVLSLLFCLISALVLIPAICMLLKPSFLKNKIS